MSQDRTRRETLAHRAKPRFSPKLILAVVCVFTVGSGYASADEIDQQLTQLLEAKCTCCHDDLGAAAGGGIDNLLDLTDLASGYLDPEEPGESYLLDVTVREGATMPKKRMGKSIWKGALTNSEKELIERWATRGGPAKDFSNQHAGISRMIISHDAEAKLLIDDINQVEAASLPSMRYLTLSNLHNNPNVSERELDVYRAAIVKSLNSLSRIADVIGLEGSDAINKLVAVDEQRTLFRFDLRHIGWSEIDWERIVEYYPYAIHQRFGASQSSRSLTHCPAPMLRADWFVFATMQPPLYHELVGIPKTLSALEKRIGIDRIHAIRQRSASRAGLERSRVSVNNRLIERIPMSRWAGSYYISYDFASNTGAQNLFSKPLGPKGILPTKHAFRHDGGEVIYNLPNGFQAYALVTADGKRIDIAPQSIVYDPTMPNGTIINGISCLSCHYQGMKPESGSPSIHALDNIRESAAANTREFNFHERELINELYPSHQEFESLLENDRKRFLEALKLAGIEQHGADEPVRELFDRYVLDLDVSSFAAEFGVSTDQFRQQMERESETRQLLLRVERGSLKRQVVEAEFGAVCRLLGLGDVRRQARLPSPFFGKHIASTSEPTLAVHSTEKTLIDGDIGVDLLDIENRTGLMQVKMWTSGNQRSYVDGEVIECHIRATDDCFLTLVTTDPSGDLVVLLPNKNTPVVKTKRGQTITLSSKGGLGEKLFATPPHGQSVLKVIATTRPLKLRAQVDIALKSNFQTHARAVRIQSAGGASTPKILSRQDDPLQLIEQTIDTQFRDSEWATASCLLSTHPR